MPVLDLISRETDNEGFIKSEKYVSEKGTEFSIVPTSIGLYTIKMHGGGPLPQICDGAFTSNLRAKQELIKYLSAGDRNGYAEYPGKTPRKAKTNGSSED